MDRCAWPDKNFRVKTKRIPAIASEIETQTSAVVRSICWEECGWTEDFTIVDIPFDARDIVSKPPRIS